MSDTEELQPDAIPCPECGQSVSNSGEQNVLVCPACGHQFFVAVLPVDEDADDQAAREDMERRLAERQQAVDSVRIRALAAERKALIRLRTYWLAAAGGCVIAIGQCIWTLVTGVLPYATTPVPLSITQRIALLVVIAWCLIGLRVFLRKARAISTELAKPVLSDPATPPDFTTLNDGSQTWKNLEAMQLQDEEKAD